ncbi:MAG TPA: hypothetical protein VGM37_21175 [Armatimonadota bacterium]|jgi:hypothetical protein
MRYSTQVRVWQAQGGVEGGFDPLSATWDYRFQARAYAEPLGDSAVRTLFDDMRVEAMRFWLDASHPELGYRWLIKDLGTQRFYLVEPASPRFYGYGIRHMEVNARRLLEGPLGL